MIRKVIFILTTLLPIIAHAAGISKLEVAGNSRISTGSILSYVKLQPHGTYDANLADASIKALYKTGFFSDVKISYNAPVVNIKVVENPLVSKIAFEGNKKVSDSDLKKEISLNEHSVYSSSAVSADAQRMSSLYQKKGRYNVTISPKIIKLDNNKVNLVYEINEGTQSKIRSINFIGNKAYSSSKLSSVIASKEYRFYNFFSSDDIYDDARLLYDQEQLRHFYMSEGFADFSVTSVDTELSPKQDAFILTFAIHEGELYSYDKVGVTSLIPAVKLDAVRSLITLKKGASFNISEIEYIVDTITNYLGDHGYAFVDVDFDLAKNREAKTTDVTFKISEGSKLYINRIDIKNNTRTLDKVIRREFTINEGDPYNQTKLLRSQQNIRSLGFFNNVNFKNLPTEQHDKVDIEVDVEEKSTGSINLGAGYSTSDGPVGQIGVSEKNFLGRGQEVDVNLSRAERTMNIDASFTEPYFLDRPLSAGFDVFRRTQGSTKQDNYHSRSIGGNLRLGYRITENLSHNMHYMLKSDNIRKVPSDVAQYIKPGGYSTSMIGHSFTYDRLDDRSDPTNGYRIQISQDYAGVGGNTRYLKHGVDARRYFPIYKKDVVLGLFASAGNIHGWGKKEVRLNDRYFIGSDQFRGFEASGIGPRSKTADGTSLGGTSYYIGTAELNFPVGLPADLGVKGATFVDMGSLFGVPTPYPNINKDNYIRGSYGVGVIWKSRMATIRLDYGIPFRKKPYDEVQRFRVQLGTQF